MTRRVVLAVILGLALVLRLVGLKYGLPAVYNPDEVAIMSRALAFAKGDLNPHNFLYPTFYFYALFGWIAASAVWAVVTGAVASFAAFQREFFLDPTRVYVAGRLLTALCGTATVAATYRLGVEVSGRTAGVCAALLLAVAPLHVRDSHYVKHDVPVTLLIVVAYLAYAACDRKSDPLPVRQGRDERSAPASSWRPLVLAAVWTGVAFSTHYYAIFLAIPLAWAAIGSAAGRSDAIKRLIAAAAVSGAVFLALSPFLLAEPAIALRDIRANRAIVVDRTLGGGGAFGAAGNYADMLWHDTMGWPAVVLGTVGLTILLRTRPARALWLLGFPVPFLLFITNTVPASRYLIPVLPFMAVFAGVAIDWTGRRWRAAVWPLAAAAAAFPFWTSVRTDEFFRQTDTRTLAARYIESHVPPGSTVLIQPYSVSLTPTAGALQEAVRRTGREMPTKTRLQMARDPYPAPAYRIEYLGEGLDADKIYVPYGQLGGAQELVRLRTEHVAFIVLKRYNKSDPGALPFLTALARKGRRIAVFSPYRDGIAGGAGPEPFLHNTDTRIDASLERPGPVMEIWQLDGPRS